VAQKQHKRRHILRLQHVQDLLGHDRLGEPGAGDRGDRVAPDVVLAALDAERVGKAQQAEFGSAVVGLAEVAVDAGS